MTSTFMLSRHLDGPRSRWPGRRWISQLAVRLWQVTPHPPWAQASHWPSAGPGAAPPRFCHRWRCSAALTFRSALLSFFIPLMKSALPLQVLVKLPRVMSPFSISTCGTWGALQREETALSKREGRTLVDGGSSLWGGLQLEEGDGIPGRLRRVKRLLSWESGQCVT